MLTSLTQADHAREAHGNSGRRGPSAGSVRPDPALGWPRRSREFVPIPIVRLELSADLPVPETNRNDEIHVLVTLHGVPLGTCWELPTTTPATDLRQSLYTEFAEPLNAHLRVDGLTIADLMPTDRAAHPCHFARPFSSELVSVVIATLGREPRLVEAVRSVLSQSHRDLELIVVDNDPERGSTRSRLDHLDDPRVQILDEPRRGTSFARNTGLHAAHGEVVAFIDDDVVADDDWLHRLVEPFAADQEVSCVTGLVLPAQIDTQAQAWFEQYGAFDKGFTRTAWSLAERDNSAAGPSGPRGALFPYSAGVYGSGNNMAFRRQALIELGGFDAALGGGAPVRGGEDLDAFLRVILSGSALVYEPGAMVRHYARATARELQRQLFGYGSGMCAVILKQLVDGDRSAHVLLRRVPAGVRYLLHPRSAKNARKTSNYPRRLTLIELSGYLAAPWLYLRSRRRRHHLPRRRRTSGGGR